MGISHLEKLYLEFEKCFWNPNSDIICHVSEDWLLTLNSQKHHTGKPILCMFLGGKACKKYAEMSDMEVIASAMKALKVMFPKAPDGYKSYLRTNWLKDRHAKMSYSFV